MIYFNEYRKLNDCFGINEHSYEKFCGEYCLEMVIKNYVFNLKILEGYVFSHGRIFTNIKIKLIIPRTFDYYKNNYVDNKIVITYQEEELKKINMKHLRSHINYNLGKLLYGNIKKYLLDLQNEITNWMEYYYDCSQLVQCEKEDIGL